MLVTKLANSASHDYLAERFRAAYDFLTSSDLMSLPLGRNEIQGDDVYANVLEYDTVPACEKELEAHRDYFDVQFVASGRELLQFADCEGLETVQAYDEADDYCLLKTPNLLPPSCCAQANSPSSRPRTLTNPVAPWASRAMSARSS